jgi:hypothetical protein
MNAASQAMSMIGGGEAGTAAAPPQAMEREFATATVTVAGEDITGLNITGTRGAKASGTITFEGGGKPENLASLRLVASPTDPDNAGAASSAFGRSTVKEPGTFEIDGLVGGRVFRFANLPKGWHLKSIRHDNEDITDKGFEFKAGDDEDGFEIVMTNRTQVITGGVTNDKNEAVKEYTVVVFPEDQSKWTISAARWRSAARPDQQGQFKVADLPPGRYLAIALEYIPEGEWMDPEWQQRMARKAVAFTLDEGATKTLDIKLAGS